jgi:hypothetical protein
MLVERSVRWDRQRALAGRREPMRPVYHAGLQEQLLALELAEMAQEVKVRSL